MTITLAIIGFGSALAGIGFLLRWKAYRKRWQFLTGIGLFLFAWACGSAWVIVY